MDISEKSRVIANPFEQLSNEIRLLKTEIISLKDSNKEDLSKRLYTITEAAKILKVSKQSVSNYIKEGKIKAENIGRHVRIFHYELYNSLEEVKSLKYKR